jgi:hypothetical protein
MGKISHIKIDTFLGETWEGILISHQRQLPKNAILLKCDYSLESMQDINLYKTPKRYYILKFSK